MSAHGFPTPTQELLLRAALAEDRASALRAWTAWRRQEAVETTDPDSGRLFPLLCRNLLRLGIDDPSLPVLKSAYRHQWVTNQQRLSRAGQALRLLGDAGLETMVLKGAALVAGYYDDVAARPMHDVDVLVAPARAHDAVRALQDAGWRFALDVPLDVLMPILNGTLLVDGRGGAVDLHWHALWSPAEDADFWSAARPVTVGGHPTLAQCPADQLLHVCVHGIWSDGRCLRWIPDALAVLRGSPELEWDRLVERARARELTLPLLDALEHLERVYGAAVPPATTSALRASRPRPWEWLGHAAWNARPSRLRHYALIAERYRRHRAVPRGPTRCPTFMAYLRRHAALRAALRARPALT